MVKRHRAFKIITLFAIRELKKKRKELTFKFQTYNSFTQKASPFSFFFFPEPLHIHQRNTFTVKLPIERTFVTAERYIFLWFYGCWP